MRWALLGLAACGRIGFDPHGDAAIAPADVDPDTVDESRCAWTNARELSGLRSPFEDAEPTLHPSGKLVVFTSTRLGSTTQRLFMAAANGDAWDAPVLIAALDSNQGDDGPVWNAAGDRLYYSSYRAGPLRLYMSAYSDTTGFGPPTLVPGLQGLSESRAITLRADELEMYYSSRLPPNHVERATRASITDAWTPHGEVTELAGTASYGFPGLSADGLTLYLEVGTFPDVQIMRSIRATVNDPWPAPVAVPTLDGANGDGDPQPSLDGTRMVFASDRTTMLDYDIWGATRICN